MAAQLPPLMPLPLVAHPAQNAEQVPSSAQPCPLSCQSAFLTFIPHCAHPHLIMKQKASLPAFRLPSVPSRLFQRAATACNDGWALLQGSKNSNLGDAAAQQLQEALQASQALPGLDVMQHVAHMQAVLTGASTAHLQVAPCHTMSYPFAIMN